MAEHDAAGPILKWAGGKQGIAEKLVRLFPSNFERYFEPFVDGGSVLFSLRPTKAVVSDANGWLIDTYRAVQEDGARVAEILDALENSREAFLEIRQILPETVSLPQRAAHLTYLNKTCFRGLFRVNRRVQFNVPYGQYDRRYYDPNNLRAVAEVLSKYELRHADFELCLHDIEDRDFVYLDPPYYKLGGSSDFNRYTKDQFRENDHFRLAALCRELDNRGVRWAVSNSDTPFVRKLFKGYQVTDVENRREINLDSKNRSISELLITNYAPETQPLQEDLFGTGYPNLSNSASSNLASPREGERVLRSTPAER